MRPLAAALILSASVVLSAQASPASTYDAWIRHRDATVSQPGLLRYYTFESIDNNAVANRTKQGGSLVYRPTKGGPAQPEIVAGRWSEKKAVRLDQGSLEGEAFSVDRAFTLSAWVRLNGQGAMRGNSQSTNGTIVSSGSGYTDGWRLTINHPQRTLDFSLGRPSPKHSKTVHTSSVAPAVWQHLAAVWDGRQMRVYLDGVLVGSGDYDEAYTPAKTWRLGYAGNGVGSVVLDVDEVAIYGRALSANDILQQAHFHVPLRPAIAQQMAAAGRLAADKDFAAAATLWQTLADRKDLAADYRAVALGELSRMFLAQKQTARAAGVLAQVIQLPAIAPSHRRNAELTLLGLLPQAGASSVPIDVCQRLLTIEGLTPAERVSLSLNLAQQCRDAGDAAAACKQYRKILHDASLSLPQQADIRLELGHTCVEARDFAAGRCEYDTVLQNNDLPAWYKTQALLCTADSWQRAGDRAAARQTLAKVSSVAGAPPHHLWEAQERSRELDRLDAGQPARDPALSRAVSPVWPKPGTEFFVAPDGRDDNPGTKARPFATLSHARDAVRQLKQKGSLPSGGVTVLLRSGEYLVQETFTLTHEDSGTADSPVVYAAFPGETARLSGGVRVQGFQPVADPAILARLPEEARSKVVQVDLRSQGVSDLGTYRPAGYASGAGFRTRPILQLFFNGKTMQLARWPNQGFVEIGSLLATESAFERKGRKGNSAGVFTYAYDRPQRWKDEKDVWLYGYWYHDWADSYEKVAAIDTDKRVITLSPPFHRYGFREGRRYYALNLLSEIDQPGEWYLDRTSGILYLYPPSDPAQAQVEVSVMESPLVSLKDVSHVRFRGLTWELARGNGLIIEGGEDCVLAGCTLRKLSGDALAITGRHHAVLGCDIGELGRGAIRMQGGDRRTLSPSGHVVENCYLHHLSRIDHTYTPGVLASGVGVRVAHNLIAFSHSSAMRVEGNDHIIECNEIHDVLEESDDQGGADMWGNPGYRGNVYRYNYWHHIGNGLGVGQAGIRLDDAISGTLIYGNIFYRCSDGNFGGVQIHGGKDNFVDNNVFVDCRSAISFSPWPEARWKEFLASPEVHNRLHREVDITRPPYSSGYPELGQLEERINVNRVWRNLAINCGQFLARDRGVQQQMDNCIAGVELAAGGRFPMPADSPLWQQAGMRRIPLDDIGLYADPLRASWPVQEQPREQAAARPRLADIPVRMQQFVDSQQISGAVTVVGRHDRILCYDAVGVRNIDSRLPMTKDTLFRIASMTKPITSVAVMILADEGKLSVDDPVEKYLPEFCGQKLVAGRNGKKIVSLKDPSRKVTLRDLLTHTSGLNRGFPPEMPDLYMRRDHTLAEVIAAVGKRPLEDEPGSCWAYCNLGIDTLGRIIEVVSGQPYEKFLQQRIFAPLGMHDTVFYPDKEHRDRMAMLYDFKEGKLVAVDYRVVGPADGARYPIPAGGLYSTGADLARFYQMMLCAGQYNGTRILSAKSVQQMTSLQTGELMAGFVPGMGFGLGWGFVRQPQGVTEMLSSGTFGHGGAFGTQGWIDPKQDLFVILLIQRVGLANGDASEMRKELQRIAVSAEK